MTHHIPTTINIPPKQKLSLPTAKPERAPPLVKPQKPIRDIPSIDWFVRIFQMPDGRRIAVDKRAMAFACEEKDHPAERSVIAFRNATKAVPVMAPFDDVLSWWLGRKPRKPASPEGAE